MKILLAGGSGRVATLLSPFSKSSINYESMIEIPQRISHWNFFKEN